MFQKMICLATIVLVIGGFKSTGLALAMEEDGRSDTVTLMWSTDEESNGGSQDKKHDELEEEMKRLMEEMKRLGKDAKERFKKDILPRIRREMEKLRKKFQEDQPGDEKSEPIGI